MTPKRQHVTLRPSRPIISPWDDRVIDTQVTGESKELDAFDDEADTMTEQGSLPPLPPGSAVQGEAPVGDGPATAPRRARTR